MIRAVFDTSTVVAADFWPRSTARHAWTLVARRQVRPRVTAGVEDGYQITCLDIQRSRFPDRSPLDDVYGCGVCNHCPAYCW